MVLKKEKGQTMAEFALMIPILILLLFGMTFAAFYAFRSASTDWGCVHHGRWKRIIQHARHGTGQGFCLMARPGKSNRCGQTADRARCAL